VLNRGGVQIGKGWRMMRKDQTLGNSGLMMRALAEPLRGEGNSLDQD
jgi:hypothetical protein